ncbi:MAG: Lrp/AsnC family transcriptional regulator [Gammaproteobacteria bacterium]|nr:Lrp/AsnC family transcriptional regulator [Pseudomonadales bacterium]MCP5348299.1 Lrp/AsnC family transcriptional regulator [Pseudomonadales bacterium]
MAKISLDRTDFKILHYLQNSGRLSNAELAEKVDLSPSPCLRRVKSLEQLGIIRRYAAIVDARAVGLPINIFVNVSLHNQERRSLEQFEARVAGYEEVMECYLMTGSFDYMLRIVVPDLESYEQFLAEKLTTTPGVSNIQSSFTLKQVVYKTELPLRSAGS